MSGNWKANIGSALLEQVPVSEKLKKWIDDISDTFGSLDICSIEAVVAKDGKEHILEVMRATGTTGPIICCFAFTTGMWFDFDFTW